MEQKEHQYFGRGFTRMHTDTSDLNPREPLLSSKSVSRQVRKGRQENLELISRNNKRS